MLGHPRLSNPGKGEGVLGERSRLGNILVGVAVGVVLASSLPVEASSAAIVQSRTLDRRVSRLERQVSGLRAATRTLQSKASQLTSAGAYTGPVEGDQINVPFLCSGYPVVWSSFSWEGLDC